MNIGDIVKFRSGKRYVIGKVVRKPDAMGRLSVQVPIITARPTVKQRTIHQDDVVKVVEP